MGLVYWKAVGQGDKGGHRGSFAALAGCVHCRPIERQAVSAPGIEAILLDTEFMTTAYQEIDMFYSIVLRVLSLLALLSAPLCFAQSDLNNSRWNWQEVSGTGIHYFDDQPGRNVIVHEVMPTETGIIQRSTETIDLFGDLEGRVLYQPVTVIDNADGTLVNTGNQVFSGTVLGMGPVLLHDEIFRFEVNLLTGETLGKVFLIDRIDGPGAICVLEIVGTGFDETGNGLAEYSGFCRLPLQERPEIDTILPIDE